MTLIISFDQTNYFLAFLVFFRGMRINGRASPRLACSYCCIYYEYARRSERPSVRVSSLRTSPPLLARARELLLLRGRFPRRSDARIVERIIRIARERICKLHEPIAA